MKIALSIAGSDSGGGAGIQADLKTFHQLGVFGTSVITAVTAQNTQGVRAWDAVRAELVAQQLAAVLEDLPPAALKTGMLGSSAIVETVADTLADRRLPYVLDPVMIATSGDRLLEPQATIDVTRRLLPLATLVTPNLREAEILTGSVIDSVAAMRSAGGKLLEMGAHAALVKGGHLSQDELADVLVTPAGIEEFRHRRIVTRSTHGTGCALSAAVTAELAKGRALHDAVSRAIEYVQRAIAAAPGLGAGNGPLGFFVNVD